MRHHTRSLSLAACSVVDVVACTHAENVVAAQAKVITAKKIGTNPIPAS